MRILRINSFNSIRDNRVTPHDVEWEILVKLLCGGHHPYPEKLDTPAFNGVRYKMPPHTDVFARRRSENIESMDILILEYDGTLTIEEAKQRFRKYEYVGYTSYRHRVETDVEKFRIVLPLKTPIQVKAESGTRSDWDALKESIREFAGPCDKKALEPNQVFFIPACAPDRMQHAQAWSNKGTWLDVSGFTRRQPAEAGTTYYAGGKPVKRSDRYLLPDDLIQIQSGGSLRAGDVKTKVEKVFCPFHVDRNGSEFIKRIPGTDRIFLYCRDCDESFYVKEDESDPTSTREETATVPITTIATIEELFDGLVDPRFAKPDRKKVEKQLAKIQWTMLDEKATGRMYGKNTLPSDWHILYLPEGAGKSLLAANIVRAGYKIVFACPSWEQVFEKHKDFAERLAPYGKKVKVLFSKEGLVRNRFKVKVVRRPVDDEFHAGEIDLDATFAAIEKANKHIDRKFFDLWWMILNDDSRFLDLISRTYGVDISEESSIPADAEGDTEINQQVDMILTTFEQVRLLTDKRDGIPRQWIVWFDDPGLSDVADIRSPDEEDVPDEGNKIKAGRKGKTRVIDGVTYQVRPRSQSLGRSVKNHLCVFTTTEKVTLHALHNHTWIIRKDIPVIHDKMELLDPGQLTILGTQAVRRRSDAIIPLIVRRLNKKGLKTTLIGDGLAAAYNHTNSKGLNSLTKTHLIVEISMLHKDRVRNVCHVLGLDFEREGKQIEADMLLDQLHQAVGRNSGYRHQGYECVVLVDKLRHAEIIKNCRYYADKENSVIIDRTRAMGRKDKRITESAGKVVKELESILNNLDEYIADQRVIRHDLDGVVKPIETAEKRLPYLARLLAALTSYSAVRFDSDVDSSPPKGSRTEPYWLLGQYLIKKYVEKTHRSTVLTEYQTILEKQEKPE